MIERERYEGGFLFVCVAFLALSFHFAPTYGRLCAELLVIGWSAFILAASLSAVRMVEPAARSRWWSRVQVMAFVLGLVCTNVFVSINYLRGGEQDPESYEARGQ